MRLCHVTIENFARFPNLNIQVRDHLVLVGANDVGKTSVLNCLNLVLGSSIQQVYQAISVEDFGLFAVESVGGGRAAIAG